MTGQRALILTLCVAFASSAVVAQDGREDGQSDAEDSVAYEYLDRSPIKCISLRRIRGTSVIADDTILFKTRGNVAYLNTLPRTCPGLETAGRFSTETRSTRLCSSDTIQVLRQFAGRIQPEAYCRLGEFHPITREEAELMELEPDELEEARRAVVMTPIDPEDEDAGEPGDAGDAGLSSE